MAIPALIAAGLSFLPKLPEIWKDIASLFGKEPPKSVKDATKLANELLNKFNQNDVPPDVELKLKNLLYQHEEKILELQLHDVQSAREREVKIVQATGEKDINLYALAWTFVIGFFTSIIIMMILVLQNKLPQSMPQYVVFLLGSLFGTLTSGVTAIIQYFFGSSKSSKDKTKLLANSQSNPPL